MKKRILCFGDSNTWGFSPFEYRRMDGRWTRSLDLNPEKIEVIEEGLSGRNAVCIDTFQPEKSGFKDFKTAILSHHPLDLIILMLGTNDLKSSYHSSARFIANGLRQYVREYMNPTLFEGMPTPKLLVVSPILLREHLPALQGPGGTFDAYSVEQSRLLADEIKAAIEPYPVEFLDASRYAKASDTDGIHMDEDNHRRLAQAISEKIRQIFGGEDLD